MTQKDQPQPAQPSLKSDVGKADGPLTISQSNPRYFTVAANDETEQRAVYLTGSHIWNNFHDGMGPGAECSQTPEQFDYEAYLAFLKQHGHNFIRLWRWEQFKSQAGGGDYHLCMTPQPWSRTGPGTAKDGKPKFNLELLDQAYFDRLHSRVIAAYNQGIYVDVMLFDGFALHLCPAPDNVEGHPFFSANNINGIGIKSILDYQVPPLDSRVQALQTAYIHKVIDTLHDLPNVLWEVANESCGGGPVDQQFAQVLGISEDTEWGDSTEWQYWVIEVVKQYEQEKGYAKHPIGMTMQFPVLVQQKINDPLFNSRAEWISPGYDDDIFVDGRHPNAPGAPQSHWLENPPANQGRKIILTDTDHYAAGKGDALWAWKSFVRGHHPILMDFGIIDGVKPSSDSANGSAAYQAFEAARYAMGDTLRYAERMNLVAMQPRGDLSSTGYALANPGQEYLILQPDEVADPFKVSLPAGTYSLEWFNINRRETREGDNLTVKVAGEIIFNTPFAVADPAIVYLKRVGE